MSARTYRFLAAAIATLTLLAAACGGDSPEATPTSSPASTPTAAVTQYLPGTPKPTSTPYTVEEPPPSGRIHTIFTFSCILGAYGPEIRVNYNITVENTDDPAATITGVQLYIDGVLREDTGPISTRAFIRQSTFGGASQRVHRLRLHIDTWAAPQPSDVVQFQQCPAVPDSPVAQVVS